MNRARSRGTVIAVAVVAIVAALIYGFRIPVIKFAVAKGLGFATGTSVSVGHLSLGGGHATISGLSISAHGERLAYVPRTDIAYNLHDLLPGSRHRYGLHAITVYNPQITVVHNPDGTYNLPHMPKGGGPARAGAPMTFTMRVMNGSLAVIDNTRLDPKARRITIDGVNFDANVNTAARTHYIATMAYNDGGVRYPIDGHGTIDAATGLNYQRWTAEHVPLPQLINYALNNANMRLRAGFLDNVNALYYGKIAASANLRGGRVTMQGVTSPIENVHGPLDVTSAGLTTPHIDATIAGAPIRINGAIYDLAHPNFRLVIHANGDVARLKKLTAAAARLPLRGNAALAMLLEGTVKSPLALILTHSQQIDYGKMPLRNPNGFIAFDGHTANIMNFGMQYGGFTLGARGRMAFVKEPNAIEALATVNGPSDQVPFASAVFPGMALSGTLIATGNSLKQIDTHGVLDGNGPNGTLASAFAVTNAGVGSVLLDAQNVHAKIALDRPHGNMSALVRANDFAIHPSSGQMLPGLPVKSLPPVTGTISGNVFASRQNNLLGLLGNVALRDAQYGKISIAHAQARFGGSPGDVRVASLNANGNFGAINARGTIAGTNHVALEGRYSGSLAQISRMAGNMPAQGYVNAPIAMVYDGGRSVAQIHNAHFTNASIRGIALNGLSATIGMRPAAHSAQPAIDVYAAHARVAQTGNAVAAGSIGNGGRIAFSVSQFPVQGGYANAAATATGSLKTPDVNGALLLRNARYANYTIGGASAFTYSGGTVGVHDAMLDAGPALVAADGTVYPRYNLDATASGLLSYSQFQGSVDANIHVTGSGKTPYVTGRVDAPEGNVHGLAFRDMHAAVAGTPQDFTVRNGSLTVGSTALAFSAAIAGKDSMQASIDAPHADLADFNDYFDTGDTLAGTGRLALTVAKTPFTLASSGNVSLQAVRYRRFDLGDTVATWNTSGRSTSVNASIVGAHGAARVVGSVAPSTRAINLNATARNVDLTNWLPLMGYNVPVTGFIDADARLRGTYPDIAMNAHANLRDGTVGRVQIQRASVSADALNGRGHITQAVVQVPYFLAQGSGTFGLHRGDPLALSVHATSPDIGKLLETFSDKPNEIAGVLDTTVNVTGTTSNPRAHDELALTQLRYAKLAVPRVTASMNITKQRVALTQGRIDLKTGAIVASGDLPTRIASRAPIALTVASQGVDLRDFTAMLPKGSRVAGALNGTLRVAGSIQSPSLGGSMALRNGYFVGPLDQNPISAMNADLLFNGTQIALQNVHANVGGGTLAMNATASVPTLRDYRAVTFNSSIVANNAQVNSPQYFRGKFDANIQAYRAKGGLPTVAGSVTIPSARIPLTAFWNPHAPKTSKKAPLPMAFNLTANVGHDVRIQSPNVDVGATGSVHVSGTMASPALSGRIAATGGTVDFLRRFTIDRAIVAFSPSDGIWPRINAVATTQITNPSAYIQLHVTGLAPNNMNLALQSDPYYDRTQILGLLAGLQNFGAVQGVASTNSGTGGFTLGGEVQNLAMGQLNTFFTRNLFEPLDASLGQALGLQNLQISDDFTSGFGVSAAKAFGKHLTATFSENLGEPRTEMVALEAHRGNSTSFDLMLYSVQDPPLTGFLSSSNPFQMNQINNNPMSTAVSGTNGLSLLYEHKFY